MTIDSEVAPLAGTPETQQVSLPKAASVFAAANILSLGISMTAGFLVAHFSNPSDLGLFNGIGLVLGYANVLQMGVPNGLNRQLPYFIGRGMYDEARLYASVAQAWAIALGSLVGCSLLAVSGWYALQKNWQYAAAFAAVAFASFTLFYVGNYLQVTYRTRGEFVQLSGINIVKNGVSLVAAVLVKLLGYYGLCIRLVLIEGTNLVLHWRGRPLRVGPRWNTKRLIELLKVGMPIFASAQLYVWWAVLNSTLVLSFLGTRPLGLYQLAVIASSTLDVLYWSVSQVIFPRLAEAYGKDGDAKALIAPLQGVLIPVALASVTMAVVGWFSIPPVVAWLLPKYTEGIAAAQWTLVAAIPLSLLPLSDFFAVVRRMHYYIACVAAGMGVYLGLLWVLSRGHLSLIAFPQALLAGRLVMVVLSLAAAGFLVARGTLGRRDARGEES